MATDLRIDPYQHQTVSLVCANSLCGRRHAVRLRCGKRSCPECRRRDYVRLLRGYGRVMSELRHPKLLTLTLRNVPELSKQGVSRLRKCMKTLLRRVDVFVRGGIYTIEVENIGNGWHIHAHVVMDSLFIPQEFLSAQWHDITGDSYIVDIREAWSPRGALSYILKYLTKEPKLLEDLKPVYNQALKGVRLIQPFGVLYAAWTIERCAHSCPDCGGTTWRIEAVFVTWISAVPAQPDVVGSRPP